MREAIIEHDEDERMKADEEELYYHTFIENQ